MICKKYHFIIHFNVDKKVTTSLNINANSRSSFICFCVFYNILWVIIGIVDSHIIAKDDDLTVVRLAAFLFWYGFSFLYWGLIRGILSNHTNKYKQETDIMLADSWKVIVWISVYSCVLFFWMMIWFHD